MGLPTVIVFFILNIAHFGETLYELFPRAPGRFALAVRHRLPPQANTGRAWLVTCGASEPT